MASSYRPSWSEVDVEDGPRFCIPADGVLRPGCPWDAGSKRCFKMECDALFTPPELRQQQKAWCRDGPPQLIVAAGPERSGSTWLYNALRLIFESAKQPLDAYWISHINNAALDARHVGRPSSNHVLIKTHEWSADWDLNRATHIFITHRDLRQVVQSYRRVGWANDVKRGYVEDHFRWKDCAELYIAFEDILGRPEDLVNDMATRLGLVNKVDAKWVVQAVNSLRVPTDFVDPVTQMWPSHMSPQLEKARKEAAASSRDVCHAALQPAPQALDYLKQQYPEYFSLYGYT